MDTREQDQQKTVKRREGNGPGRVEERGAQPPDSEEARSRPRKRIFFGIAVVIVVIVAVIWGIPWLNFMLSHEGTDDAHVAADVVAVTSKIPERIDRILVDTNQPVRRGQLLIVLDNKDELAKLRQARAQYDLAIANQRATTEQGQGGVSQASGEISAQQAQVPVAQDAVAQAQSQLRAAQAQVPAATQAYDKTQADLSRASSLVSTGDVAAQTLDAARAQNAGAAAQLRAAQDQVSVAEANVAAAEGRVSASNAAVSAASGALTTAQGKLAQASDPSQVEGAAAQLYLAKQNLDYTRIYAATDGYVGQKSAEVGQTIGAGMTLMTIVPHHVYITANYKETQMGRMRVGQSTDIHVDAYKGVTFRGHVASINPASENTYALVPAQNASGNFVKVTQRIPVRIEIDEQRSDMPLRPGMSVETYVRVK
ncbi:MAG: HlyD family secretion protein [Candidatus Eremiobacteraeota bacterium]|nr:HlyD family secretion protein [Candidatus Eremiobacteraeota bacterium]MBV8499967.1 HlyD family secretion protein [Candidatus Eremiobacteraeota bacterium]